MIASREGIGSRKIKIKKERTHIWQDPVEEALAAAEAADLVEAASAAEALAAAEGALVARTSIIMVRISTADGSLVRATAITAVGALVGFSV